jgi:hypothetical protein
MRRLYENKDEETFHQRAIEGLAQETAQPIAGVKAVYEVEFIKLKSDAKITAYLALLARRRARESLRRKQV